jgi:hypothetical protein
MAKVTDKRSVQCHTKGESLHSVAVGNYHLCSATIAAVSSADHLRRTIRENDGEVENEE